MTPETLNLVIGLIGTFLGSLGGAWFISTRTTNRLKPLEQRAEQQSQTMQTIKDDSTTLKRRIVELETDKALAQEARVSRDLRISELEGDVGDLKADVKNLTDEKAEIIRERNDLQVSLTKAEGQISALNIRIVRLEAQVEAEKNASQRIVQPIVEALARLAIQPHTGDTGNLSQAVNADHDPAAGQPKTDAA